MGATNSTQSPVTLKTPKGSLRGIELSDAQSEKPVYHRYTRVPYALPPTGPLRWQKPQPLPEHFSFSNSAGEPGDYASFGPICPQPVYQHTSACLDGPDAAPQPENVQSEDCLYLNVWVPAGRDGEMPAEGWPVQFFIHGGWLQVGDAMQNNVNDPFDLLLHTSHPRIIISPTYRLNLFGFLCCPTDPKTSSPPSSSSSVSPCPGNFGFWDQRLALEWTHQNISLFSGNPLNITVGGLSAGAHSALFQLHHDTYLNPPDDHRPIIRRVYLWSNAVGIQPNGPSSKAVSSQFDELTSHFNIPATKSTSEKLSSLHAIPAEELVSAIPQMKWHTFRAVTDDDFIPQSFLRSVYHRGTKRRGEGGFSHRLKSHGVKVFLGEVAHESRLYALVNAPSCRADLEMQLKNYYPENVVDAQLRYYSTLLPPPPNGSEEERTDTREEEEEEEEQQQPRWRDVYARIVADAQVHATMRGLTRALVSSSPHSPRLHPGTHDDDDDDDDNNNDEHGLNSSDVFRYRISWRAKCLDAWLKPSMGVGHGADAPIWWCSGWRAGYTEEDKRKAATFLEPFGRFIYGKNGGIGWGTRTETEGRGVVRCMGEDGETRLVLAGEDEEWERGMVEVWDMMCRAQEEQMDDDFGGDGGT